jgi:YggT family protein
MIPQGSSMLGNLATILHYLLQAYLWIVIIRVIISWVNPSPNNTIVQYLAKVTDPALLQIRRLFPVSFGGLDLSPILLILLIAFFDSFLAGSLLKLGQGASVNIFFPMLLFSLLQLVKSALYVYMIIIIARAVISWISPDPYNPIVRIIYGLTEPLMYRLRSAFPLVYGGMDFTPIVFLAGIYIALMFLDQLLLMASRML